MPSKGKSAKETSKSTPTSPPGDRLNLVDRTNEPGPDAFQFIGLERPGTGAVQGDGPVDRTGAGSRAPEVRGRGAEDEAAQPQSGTTRPESSEPAAAASEENIADRRVIVTLDEFPLDFATETGPSGPQEEDEEDVEYDRFEELWKMQEAIPRDALEFGPIDDEVDGAAMSTVIEIYFYLIPRKSDQFTWALFGISWEDAWDRWEWQPYARASAALLSGCGPSPPVRAATGQGPLRPAAAKKHQSICSRVSLRRKDPRGGSSPRARTMSVARGNLMPLAFELPQNRR